MNVRGEELVNQWEKALLNQMLASLQPSRNYVCQHFDHKVFDHHYDFSNADCGYASFINSTLMAVNFSGANLGFSQLNQAILISANFHQARAVSANFESANLYKVNAAKANFRLANFRHACLANGNFQSADFSKANLIGANIALADFTNANFTGAQFVDNALFTDTLDKLLDELDWLYLSVSHHQNRDALIHAIANDVKRKLSSKPANSAFENAIHSHPLMVASKPMLVRVAYQGLSLFGAGPIRCEVDNNTRSQALCRRFE